MQNLCETPTYVFLYLAAWPPLAEGPAGRVGEELGGRAVFTTVMSFPFSLLSGLRFKVDSSSCGHTRFPALHRLSTAFFLKRKLVVKNLLR